MLAGSSKFVIFLRATFQFHPFFISLFFLKCSNYINKKNCAKDRIFFFFCSDWYLSDFSIQSDPDINLFYSTEWNPTKDQTHTMSFILLTLLGLCPLSNERGCLVTDNVCVWLQSKSTETLTSLQQQKTMLHFSIYNETHGKYVQSVWRHQANKEITLRNLICWNALGLVCSTGINSVVFSFNLEVVQSGNVELEEEQRRINKVNRWSCFTVAWNGGTPLSSRILGTRTSTFLMVRGLMGQPNTSEVVAFAYWSTP